MISTSGILFIFKVHHLFMFKALICSCLKLYHLKIKIEILIYYCSASIIWKSRSPATTGECPGFLESTGFLEPMN